MTATTSCRYCGDHFDAAPRKRHCSRACQVAAWNASRGGRAAQARYEARPEVQRRRAEYKVDWWYNVGYLRQLRKRIGFKRARLTELEQEFRAIRSGPGVVA